MYNEKKLSLKKDGDKEKLYIPVYVIWESSFCRVCRVSIAALPCSPVTTATRQISKIIHGNRNYSNVTMEQLMEF